jgi:hypothetical protein
MTSYSNSDNSETERMLEERFDFGEKVNKYYELKSIYENTIQEKKKKIKKNGIILRWSKKELADAFQKYTPKCVSCFRDVGSAFEKKKIDGVYHLTARCGSEEEPCQLHIDIQMGDIMNVYKMKKENEKLMKQYIDEIIIIKNDELFSFINEELAVDRWTSVNEKLDDVVEEYREVLTMYLQKINKSENKSRIESANKQLSELIVTSKKNISSFHSAGNSKFIRETVEIYVNEILPLIHELNSLQYENMMMDYDKETKQHQLVQKTIAVDTFHLHGNTEVIRFEVGKQFQPKTQMNKGEREAEFSQGPLTDNIVDMSMRNAIESDDEADIIEEPDKQLTSTGQLPMQPITLQPDNEDLSLESDAESDAESEMSEASIDDEPLPSIKIGMELDSSSSDGYIPPPPPLEEDQEETE